VFEIVDTYTTEGVTEEDFLMIAANCIGGRQHPISKLLSGYMNKYLSVENVMEFPGKGVECTIMGKSFVCGSEQFIKNCGVDIGDLSGYTIYVTIDSTVMGALRIQDTLKNDTSVQLDSLRETGVEKIVLFSSDDAEKTQVACMSCGADEYYPDLTPYARAEIIERLKTENDDMTCAYIGDVSEGSQAMESADVGILLVRKTDTSIEHSKIALLGDLSSVAEVIEIARLACGKIELHFYCATAIKLVLALLALFGAVNIAAAIVIDALLTGVALISSLDLMKK